MAAASILRQINSSNYTNGIATIYRPPLGHSGFITTLRLTVNLKSIDSAEFPYIPDETPPAVFQQILNEVALNTEFKEIILFLKKEPEDWVERCPIKIFNKEPFYDVNLMRIFSDANTIDVADDFSLGIQVKVGDTLTEVDNILVWGSVVEEKKNNGNEELKNRIEALELAIGGLSGRLTDLPANVLLGRNSGTGIVESIPQNTFAQPADISEAIFDFYSSAPLLKVGGNGKGFVQLQPGSASNSGYLEIYRSNGSRNGYIGFDNSNLTYVAENNAVHSFTGGRVDITGGIVPQTTSSRLSFFINGNNSYSTWICSTANVGYKAYDMCNESGNFSLRRINDDYTSAAGNLLTHSTSNILTIGNSTTRAAGSYGSITLYGYNGTYAGIEFANASNTPIMMFSIVSKHHGVWAPNTNGGWHYIYNEGNFSVRSSGTEPSEGTFIGINKGLGALPGYPYQRYPTLITDFSNLYFSAGGTYSATMSSNGTITAISDKNKKNIIEPIDGTDVLNKILKLPVNRFHFNNEDPRITRIGTFAQDFYEQFQCGGDQEIIDDDSPINPSTMLAVSDVAGVCLAGIQALNTELAALKNAIQELR